ncbi:MAG: serine hydrolase domain-containing protein [Thermodesulfobacteriota bacterium]
MQFDKAHQEMLRGLSECIFTGAVLLVAKGEEVLFHEPYGRHSGPGSPQLTRESLFDLASLTKILATTPAWIVLGTESPQIFDRGLEYWFPDCPSEKRSITPRHLLAHASGLPAWRPYYLHTVEQSERADFTLRKIFAEPLEYSPGQGCVYSDLGFMLLGFLLAAETGEDLAAFAQRRIIEPLGLAEDLLFRPAAHEGRLVCTRRDDPSGLVNDLNARALGGVAGHAGLFGTAQGAARLMGHVLRSMKREDGFFDHATVQLFSSPSGFRNCTRALGFDMPGSEAPSSGRYFSPNSLGHTGFTGTSAWLDPEKDLVVVLLTNRVYMGEADFRIKQFRPAVHDAVMQDLGYGRTD